MGNVSMVQTRDKEIVGIHMHAWYHCGLDLYKKHDTMVFMCVTGRNEEQITDPGR